MKILDFSQMNDWPIKTFLILLFNLHLLLWGSIGLDSVGIRIPILRQLVCFIYLTFVPGILILRILRLHKLGSIKFFLYSIGLSLSFLMFVGFFMNMFYPLIGINRPLALVPLVVTVSFVVLLLCAFCYQIDRTFSYPSYLNLKNIVSVPSLFLGLIPILTILGTYLMNSYNKNWLLMIAIFLIALIVILISFNYIQKSLFPLAILVTSFSLLFHTSLISNHIFGWDIHMEYFEINRVLTNSSWNMSRFSNLNAMLSIVMIAPIYSIFSNLDPTWVLKIIYPTIFSFISVGLYFIFKKQTNSKIAFMAVFFFVSFYGFFNEMPILARQEIAEYFFMLIILLIVENKQDMPYRVLLILFSFSVVVSHYGLSYLILVSIIFIYLSLYIYKKYLNVQLFNDITNFTFTSIFTAFLFTWYIYVSSSSPFYTIFSILKDIIQSFISDFLNPNATEGLFVLSTNAVTPLHELGKIIHIFTQILISIGILYIIKNYSHKFKKLNREYLFFSIAFYLILIASIIVPHLSNALNTSRIYHITLILLAPYSVIGGFIFLKTCFSKVPQLNIKGNYTLPLKTLSIFFAIYLLFNTGWLYEILGDSPTSYSLNKQLDFPMSNDRDVAGKEWLCQINDFGGKKRLIYADLYRQELLYSCFDYNEISVLPENINQIIKNSYIYLSTYNIMKNEILRSNLEYTKLDPYVFSKNQVYDNGGAEIYY